MATTTCKVVCVIMHMCTYYTCVYICVYVSITLQAEPCSVPPLELDSACHRVLVILVS